MKSSRGEDGWISWRDSLAFGSCRYNGKKDVRDLEEGSTILTHLYVSRNRTSLVCSPFLIASPLLRNYCHFERNFSKKFSSLDLK